MGKSLEIEIKNVVLKVLKLVSVCCTSISNSNPCQFARTCTMYILSHLSSESWKSYYIYILGVLKVSQVASTTLDATTMTSFNTAVTRCFWFVTAPSAAGPVILFLIALTKACAVWFLTLIITGCGWRGTTRNALVATRLHAIAVLACGSTFFAITSTRSTSKGGNENHCKFRQHCFRKELFCFISIRKCEAVKRKKNP